MELTEAEDIKKRSQEYTEELYKNDVHEQDNHDDINTHVEPDILECEVKWALTSITTNKASGGDGIPVELFQILKDDVVKVLHSNCQQIWNSAFKLVYLSLSPFLFTSFLFPAICKVCSYNHFAFLRLFFLVIFLIAASCTMSQTSIHISSETSSIRSNPLNLFLTSTVFDLGHT